MGTKSSSTKSTRKVGVEARHRAAHRDLGSVRIGGTMQAMIQVRKALKGLCRKGAAVQSVAHMQAHHFLCGPPCNASAAPGDICKHILSAPLAPAGGDGGRYHKQHSTGNGMVKMVQHDTPQRAMGCHLLQPHRLRTLR